MSDTAHRACRNDRAALLLHGVAAGDHATFAELYDLMATRAYGLALRVLQDQAHAEDAVEDVMLEVWRRAGCFDADRQTAMSWLMAITHRHAVERVRSLRASSGNRFDGNQFEPGLHRVAASATATSTQPAGDATALHLALADLPAAQRATVEAAYFEGCTHHQISRLQQTPAGTARHNIRDGLLRLRAQLTVISGESSASS